MVSASGAAVAVRGLVVVVVEDFGAGACCVAGGVVAEVCAATVMLQNITPTDNRVSVFKMEFSIQESSHWFHRFANSRLRRDSCRTICVEVRIWDSRGPSEAGD